MSYRKIFCLTPVAHLVSRAIGRVSPISQRFVENLILLESKSNYVSPFRRVVNVIQGRIHPAGMKGAQYGEEHISSVARHFSIGVEKLHRVLAYLENCDKPEIALLQNPDPNGEVQAACFVSSTWSRSYKLELISRREIHRDFHYQCLFTAMSSLAEVGCTIIRVENLMTNYKWKRDAYICLIEAWRNIGKYVNPDIRIQLLDGSYDRAMVDGVTHNYNPDELNDHRPIAMSPYVREGLNMRKIFLPIRTTT